jgi:hypothetical protein
LRRDGNDADLRRPLALPDRDDDQDEDRRGRREGGHERKRPFLGMRMMTAADASFHSLILTDFGPRHQKIKLMIKIKHF